MDISFYARTTNLELSVLYEKPNQILLFGVLDNSETETLRYNVQEKQIVNGYRTGKHIRVNLSFLVSELKGQLPFRKEHLSNVDYLQDVGIALHNNSVFYDNWSGDISNIHSDVLREYKRACAAMRTFSINNALLWVNSRAEDILPNLDQLVDIIQKDVDYTGGGGR